MLWLISLHYDNSHQFLPSGDSVGTSRQYLRGKYHFTIDLFNYFWLVCFANKNKNCQLLYSWFQTGQIGGQWYSDTSPFSIPWYQTCFATLFSEKLYNGSQLTTTFTAQRLSQNLELCSILSCSRYCQLFIESNQYLWPFPKTTWRRTRRTRRRLADRCSGSQCFETLNVPNLLIFVISYKLECLSLARLSSLI